MFLAVLVAGWFSSTERVFEPDWLDQTVAPCSDFYTYACGGWQKKNPIPADKTQWDAYTKLQEQNVVLLRQVLDKTKQQKLADYHAACLDEAAAETTPALAGLLGRIDKLGDDLPELLGSLHQSGISSALFGFGPQQSFRDATQWIAVLDQGGLGLPERDYYLKTDARSKSLQDGYVKHIARMLKLSGSAAPDAQAQAIMRLETQLAQASMDNVARTDSKNLDHWTATDSLPAGFAWKRYMTAVGTGGVAALNVATPDFFKALGATLGKTKRQDLIAYLRWHVLHELAPVLGKRFVDEDFDFFHRTLRGAKEQAPRWKRCVQMADAQLGELLGEAFVNAYFPGAAKQKTADMVRAVQAAMAARLQTLDWMSEPTRQKAKQKLERMQNNIGYPDKWRDYSSVDVKRADFLGNVLRAAAFESHRQLAKIGKPVERGEWQMTPPTVNAYYNPQMNEMNFPAGVLLPPLFDAAGDMAANYGDTGATIGHELTHGFDSDGRQYDAFGNLKDWWTDADAQKFQQKAQCIVDQYKEYIAVGDVHINSKLTLAEDIADLGGTILAYEAWKKLGDKAASDGFSPEQRFFLAYGQSFCNNIREEEARLRAAVDVHSPPRHRINGVVANMPEFAQAFSCKAPNKNVCRVW